MAAYTLVMCRYCSLTIETAIGGAGFILGCLLMWQDNVAGVVGGAAGSTLVSALFALESDRDIRHLANG